MSETGAVCKITEIALCRADQSLDLSAKQKDLFTGRGIFMFYLLQKLFMCREVRYLLSDRTQSLRKDLFAKQKEIFNCRGT